MRWGWAGMARVTLSRRRAWTVRSMLLRSQDSEPRREGASQCSKKRTGPWRSLRSHPGTVNGKLRSTPVDAEEAALRHGGGGLPVFAPQVAALPPGPGAHPRHVGKSHRRPGALRAFVCDHLSRALRVRPQPLLLVSPRVFASHAPAFPLSLPRHHATPPCTAARCNHSCPPPLPRPRPVSRRGRRRSCRHPSRFPGATGPGSSGRES